MKVLTYASYKEHCKLYTEIHGSIAVNSCQIGLFKKDKILLEDNKLFKYSYSKASSSGVFNLDDYIQFTLSSGTYSIDDFNKKIKAAVLQQKQNWNAPHIKNLKLVVPENYAFTADNNFLIVLGMPEKILKNINMKYSLVFSGSYKTQLVTTTPQKSLSLHCNQINKVKNELDGQPSSLSACVQVFDSEATFSPMYLVFLELETHCYHLDFKILDENNNEAIPRTFYLQLLNKNGYIRQ